MTADPHPHHHHHHDDFLEISVQSWSGDGLIGSTLVIKITSLQTVKEEKVLMKIVKLFLICGCPLTERFTEHVRAFDIG